MCLRSHHWLWQQNIQHVTHLPRVWGASRALRLRRLWRHGKLVSLLHKHPHSVTKVSTRVDGGANFHIFNEECYFIVLYRKEIPCTLANGEKSRFQGVGIAVREISPGNFVLLAPSYLSMKDDVCTISPGALKWYSKCIEAMYKAIEYLKITLQNKQSVKMKVETAAGLDYVKLILHRFRRPMKTKLQRNPFLRMKPKQFIFRSGLEPQDPATINRIESNPSSTSETSKQGMAPSELLPKAASNRSNSPLS